MDINDEHLLKEVLGAKPSHEGWRAVSALLSRLSGDALLDALALAAPIKQWPTEIRWAYQGCAASTWLASAFDELPDPRLLLLDNVYISHRSRLDGANHTFDFRSLYPIAVTFAQHIAPSFSPLDSVVHTDFDDFGPEEGNIVTEKRGTVASGMCWRCTNNYEELPYYTSEGDWEPYGFPGCGSVSVGYRLRGREDKHGNRGAGVVDLVFVANGPVPLALELAHAWGSLQRNRSLTQAAVKVALDQARETWALCLRRTWHPRRR